MPFVAMTVCVYNKRDGEKGFTSSSNRRRPHTKACG